MASQNGLERLILELKREIVDTEVILESWISTVGKELSALLQHLHREGLADLLKTGISLRDSLIKRYLWQEAILDSQIYMYATLSRRLNFSETLKSNCKTVKHHYFSNCIHYLPEKSKQDVLRSLQIKLKFLFELKKKMEKFDKKIVSDYLKNCLIHPSEAKISQNLEKLLNNANKKNKILIFKLEKLLRETKRREDDISAMEGKYFRAVAEKYHSEKWMSQAALEKKADLFSVVPSVEKRKRRGNMIKCFSCSSKNQKDSAKPFEFTLDKAKFEKQVMGFILDVNK